MTPLDRLIHKVLPPPGPVYGPCRLTGDCTKPKGLRRQLYKIFPPPLRTDVPWYSPSLTTKIKEHGAFYSSYTGLEGEELADHVHAIRDRVWAFAPYPCIGRGWFLLPGLSGMKIWPEVVDAARDGKTVLDLGCGLGQDIRRLRYEAQAAGSSDSDGYDEAMNLNLYASDVRKEMWDMGDGLFRDKDQEQSIAKFLHADARRIQVDGLPGASFGEGGRLEEIRGRVDVVMVSQLLDLFYWHDQTYIGKTIVELSHVGTKVIGRTFGVADRKAGEYSREGDIGIRTYNDVHSLGALWWDIGDNTDTSWKVKADEVEFDDWDFDQEDIDWLKDTSPMDLGRNIKGLQFVVVRVSLQVLPKTK